MQASLSSLGNAIVAEFIGETVEKLSRVRIPGSDNSAIEMMATSRVHERIKVPCLQNSRTA